MALTYNDIPATELTSESLSWLGRYLVARHPNVDQATLERLARDTNRFVRAAARARLTLRSPIEKVDDLNEHMA